MRPLPPPQPEFPPLALALLGLGFVVLLLLASFSARLLCRLLRLERANFRGDRVPASVGIGFLIVTLAAYGVLSATSAPLAASAPLFLVVAAGFGFLGLFDDLYGARTVGKKHAGGFRGHLRSLATARPTTGALKLIGGGIVALVASALLHAGTGGLNGLYHAYFPFLLDALLIALSANALNLLDVRPGRAQFGFLLLCLPILWAVLHQGLPWITLHPPPATLLGPLVFAVLIEWLPDSRGRAMMGDCGANLLGAVAGLAAATVLPLWGRIALCAVVLALNLIAERWSLSALIEKNTPLRAFDRGLGVR